MKKMLFLVCLVVMLLGVSITAYAGIEGYIDGDGLTITEGADLNIGTFNVGKTNIDGLKYAFGYEGSYYPLVYKSMEVDGKLYESLVYGDKFTTEIEAIAVASEVPKGVDVSISLNTLGIVDAKSYNSMCLDTYFVIYKGDTLECKISLANFNKILVKNQFVDTTTFDVSVSEIIKDSSGSITGAKVMVSWFFGEDIFGRIPKAVSLKLGENEYELDRSIEGIEYIEFTAPVGIYDWIIITDLFQEHKGTFEITEVAEVTPEPTKEPEKNEGVITPVPTVEPDIIDADKDTDFSLIIVIIGSVILVVVVVVVLVLMRKKK